MDNIRIRRKLAAEAPKKGAQKLEKGEKAEEHLNWTELHDALTSMRAHGKAIPASLDAEDLDMINARVRPHRHSLTCLTSKLDARARMRARTYHGCPFFWPLIAAGKDSAQ
jgi:hypothetical protein